MAKVLLVEDDQDLANNVRTFLLFENHSVEMLHDGAEAASQLKVYEYDLIILDWELPGQTGVEICKEFRSRGGQTPVIMLTGRKKEVEDKEAGLDSGADDYLTKPFHLKELAARIRALLRRSGAKATSNILEGGNIALDVSKYRATVGGVSVKLLPKEFQLLEFLMRNPNEVFSAEALLNRVWPSDSEATDKALRTTIKRLRKKVDPDAEIIKTVHSVGYIFEVS